LDSTANHADENGSSDKFDLSVDNSTNAAAMSKTEQHRAHSARQSART